MTLRATAAVADNWDTYNTSGQFSAIPLNLLNNLTILDAVDGSTIRSDLATSWDVSADGKTVTYRLRRDVRWHDGKEFSAGDVISSIAKAKRPDDPTEVVHVNRLAAVETVDAPDPLTVRITLAKPSVSFLVFMSVPPLTIYPAHLLPIKEWQSKKAIGTGPFVFKEHKFADSAELVRNPRYFKSDAQGTALPYLDGVRYIWINDHALAASAFRTGRIDCACILQSDLFPTFKDEAVKEIPGLQVGGGTSLDFLFFNTARPPFNSVTVRRAVSIGIDRKFLADSIRGGGGYYPPGYFVPEGRGGKLSLPDKELQGIPGFRVPKDADIQLARQLFAEAGVNPAALTPQYLSTQPVLEVAEAVASVLAGLGIKVKVDLAAGGAGRLEKLRRGDFDMADNGGGGSFDDPADFVIPYASTGGGQNYGKYSNPQVDAILTQQETELDPVKRRSLLADVQRKLLEDAAFVPLHLFPVFFGAQPFVRGFPVDRAYVVSSAWRHETVWFDR